MHHFWGIGGSITFLFLGLDEISSALQTVKSGQPLEKPIPSLSAMIKRTQNSFETEISSHNLQEEKTGSSEGYFVLVKAITICLNEKKSLFEKKKKFEKESSFLV